MCAKSLQLCLTSQPVAHRAPLIMRFSGQEYRGEVGSQSPASHCCESRAPASCPQPWHQREDPNAEGSLGWQEGFRLCRESSPTEMEQDPCLCPCPPGSSACLVCGKTLTKEQV